jgi:DNA-binding transcriptional MerR regulator
MRILSVAQVLGVSPDWIRKQERAGTIPPARRDRNGHRRYTEEDVKHIRQLLFRNPSEEEGKR